MVTAYVMWERYVLRVTPARWSAARCLLGSALLRTPCRRMSILEAVKLVKEKREWLLTNEHFRLALVKLATTLDLLETQERQAQLEPLVEEEEEEEEE